jgi:putative zinc finger/helix-turn-helix YgiT family protein
MKNETEEFCPSCEEYCETKVSERDETYTVRDRRITVSVKATLCAACGESIGSDEDDQAILDAVHAEYRRQTDMLTPERIKDIRKRYLLSQRSFAALLGMSEATINRYEQGGLQDQVHDEAIRACETPSIVRGLLERHGGVMSQWQRDRVEQALAGAAEPASTILDTLGEVDWVCMPKEVTDKTGFRRFEYKRFAAVVAWFCNRLEQVSRTTMNKLVFYADFLSFKTATVSLTGAAYRRLEYGPVPADYGGLFSRMESEDILVSQEREYPNGYIGFYYSVGPEAASLDIEFTPHQRKVLEHVARTLGGMTAKAISDKSHQESAWKDTGDKEYISFTTAASLSLSLPE